MEHGERILLSWLFDSLPASPGSIRTAVVGGSLPFILLPFFLAPELQTQGCGGTWGKGSGNSQTPTVCQVVPPRKFSC